jgi:ribosomal protein L16 Arg81 hydroxylase
MYFNEQVFGNAFFSRESSSSFPAHIDKYPVFACQLLGTKKWWIYDRLQQTVCTQIVETNIGDILYIPKGVPHMAKANTISFHDSIAIT